MPQYAIPELQEIPSSRVT